MINSLLQDTILNPLLEELEASLNQLVLEWRSCENPQLEKQIETHYQDILHLMIRLGFQQALDMDAELPHELMPQEYFDLFKQS